MKKVLIVILLFPFFSFLSPDYKSADFIGKWRGEDKGDIGYVVFDSAGYASFQMGEEIFGGKEFISAGQKCNMKYKINDTISPIHIDFIITKEVTKEHKKLLGIAMFKDADNMILAIEFENNTRPTVFNKENSILLTRVK